MAIPYCRVLQVKLTRSTIDQVDEWQPRRVRAKHAAVGHVVASIMHVYDPRLDTHAVRFVNGEVDCHPPFARIIH